MEPLFPKAEKPMIDLAMQVFREGAELSGLVHPITRMSIVNLLRHINSFYSNRIEGEQTNPIDIERAVRKEYSEDAEKSRLQKLSVAHINVQKKIDDHIEKNPNLEICSKDFICWIHEEFYKSVPNSFLEIKHPETGEIITMTPGRPRERNVKVGNHIAPDFRSLNEFLDLFEERYSSTKLSGERLLLAVAASHHRLAWIHPFLDGNGRVGRLFTYAYLRKAKFDSYGLWTLSRGFARNEETYKSRLATADNPRSGDLDGRGNLSEKGLNSFCTFFYEQAMDQIKFMKSMLRLDELSSRIEGYVNLRAQGLIPNEPVLRPEAKYVLSEVMIKGEIPRGEISRLIGMAERTARQLTSKLLAEELVTSTSHRAPLRFNIPTKVIGYYFPELYPAGSTFN